MKRLTIFLVSLFALFSAGFISAKLQLKVAAFFQKPKAPQQFISSDYPIYNQSFVIVVLGRDNGMHVEKTLRSVLSQNYDNFRVVYIDDGSSDGSFLQARDIAYGSGKAERVLLLKNKEPLGEFQNLIHVAEHCKSDEILVVVDGDDLLSHDWVLSKLNQYYANPDLWMALGSSLERSSFTPLPKNLRTFYASMLKNISESYAVDPEDLSYVELLMEQNSGHTQHLDEILYLVQQQVPEEEICDL